MFSSRSRFSPSHSLLQLYTPDFTRPGEELGTQVFQASLVTPACVHGKACVHVGLVGLRVFGLSYEVGNASGGRFVRLLK